ncbi:MAG: hypothetical protein CMP57_05445 [Flavobacteriales bacterium]|nr:hypothetical protein [Flavobacteriales bacterium]
MRLLTFFILCFLVGCQSNSSPDSLQIGAAQMDKYIGLLQGKRVALVANQSSEVNGVHLVDTLLSMNIHVEKVFAPEHGFRGLADAGSQIHDTTDKKTGLAIYSLYGSSKKPTKKSLDLVDIMVFDLQDVGARFYTYISTLHYVMEACAENNIPLLVLDRPNPNGHYVSGPVLEPKFASFVGMHPIPIVHGMTLAEYAQMINGEYWLSDSLQCQLYCQEINNYTHQTSYNLPVKPSPNLPNSQSISLYPSLCLFEGTDLSVGRGTKHQFQILGSPFLDSCSFSFTPISKVGATYPKHQDKECYGWDLHNISFGKDINLSYLIDSHRQYMSQKRSFFNSFFDKLSGSTELRKQIESGWTASQIKETWADDLEDFKKMRQLYLLYP